MPRIDIRVTYPTHSFSVEFEFKSVVFLLFIGRLSAKTILNPALRRVIHQTNNCIKPLRWSGLQKSEEGSLPIHRGITMPPVGKAKMITQRGSIVGIERLRFLDANRQQYFPRHLRANRNQAV